MGVVRIALMKTYFQLFFVLAEGAAPTQTHAEALHDAIRERSLMFFILKGGVVPRSCTVHKLQSDAAQQLATECRESRTHQHNPLWSLLGP